MRSTNTSSSSSVNELRSALFPGERDSADVGTDGVPECPAESVRTPDATVEDAEGQTALTLADEAETVAGSQDCHVGQELAAGETCRLSRRRGVRRFVATAASATSPSSMPMRSLSAAVSAQCTASRGCATAKPAPFWSGAGVHPKLHRDPRGQSERTSGREARSGGSTGCQGERGSRRSVLPHG